SVPAGRRSGPGEAFRAGRRQPRRGVCRDPQGQGQLLAMSPALIFKPVTAETVRDFQSLFGAPGAPKYCWCMTWRASSDELKHTKSPSRQRQMLGRIAEGVPVGLLAYLAGVPVAWVSVAPKASFRGLGGPEDDLPVWSLT